MRAEVRVRVDLRLPPGLVARVDAERGGLSRTKFFERALERALASDKEPAVPVTERPKIRSGAARAKSDSGSGFVLPKIAPRRQF